MSPHDPKSTPRKAGVSPDASNAWDDPRHRGLDRQDHWPQWLVGRGMRWSWVAAALIWVALAWLAAS